MKGSAFILGIALLLRAFFTGPMGPEATPKPRKPIAVVVDRDWNYPFVILGWVEDDYPGEVRYWDQFGEVYTYTKGLQPGDTLKIWMRGD